jgi:hypothetical protein
MREGGERDLGIGIVPIRLIRSPWLGGAGVDLYVKSP